MLRQILLSVWWVLEQSTLLSFTDSESVSALYNAATSAAPLNTSDPLLLECQEIISLRREAWKDGFSYKYVFAGKKINHGFKVITHSTSLCDGRAFLSPLALSAEQLGVCDGGHVSLWSPLYRRVLCSGNIPQVDNEAGNNSSYKTTWESHKLEQEKDSWRATKKADFTKGPHSVAGHFLLLVGGRQSPLLKMKKQLAPSPSKGHSL